MPTCTIAGCPLAPFGFLDGDLYCEKHGTPEAIAAARLQAILVPRLIHALYERPDGSKQSWLNRPKRDTRLAKYELWNFLEPLRVCWNGTREEFQRRLDASELESILAEMIVPATEAAARKLIESAPTSGLEEL